MAGEKVERLAQQHQYFLKALARLQEALAEPESSFVRDSIIKRYEMAFGLGWKALLARSGVTSYEKEGGNARQYGGSSYQDMSIEVLRGLVGADAQSWLRMRDDQCRSSQPYDETREREMIARVRDGGVQALQRWADVLTGPEA